MWLTVYLVLASIYYRSFLCTMQLTICRLQGKNCLRYISKTLCLSLSLSHTCILKIHCPRVGHPPTRSGLVLGISTSLFCSHFLVTTGASFWMWELLTFFLSKCGWSNVVFCMSVYLFVYFSFVCLFFVSSSSLSSILKCVMTEKLSHSQKYCCDGLFSRYLCYYSGEVPHLLLLAVLWYLFLLFLLAILIWFL